MFPRSFTKVLSLAALMLASLVGFNASAQSNPNQGTWTTTLQGRDLNGDHVADAYYDTSLNVTWLRDANYAATTGFAPGGGDPFYTPAGGMTYGTATNWVANLDINGTTGWRMPNATFTATAADSGCSIFFLYPPAGCNYRPETSSNELAHLFYVTLGNSQAGPGESGRTNAGNFVNFAPSEGNQLYYTGNPVELGGYTNYQTFSMSQGIGVVDPQDFVPSFAWVVHDGDVGVAAIPEPGTYALMMLGLVAVGAAARRRQQKK